ncbi:MAG: pseudouridine-5'-phosphate glycosidase [Clostridiales bacterium]|nr:pseudouridine-5'-phosphate glycosidase [Clostridiales bacterium]MDY5348030.1 pseudouridine-5'-phosphate glycosidase [Candidatus Ventricola sp.]MDY5513387.1 pseudouridine-5'-phosphate glycosidase [Candidatus Ventricola sp.]
MSTINLKQFMDITPEIEEAVRTGKPVVALESTILSHGMPYPENLGFAREVEKIIRAEGAVPATMAVIDGRLKAGLTEEELVRMCEAKDVLKVSRRDLPIVVAKKLTGATTVATTMILANLAGVHVFATGGIGGVHRGGEDSMDISADLQELAHTPVAVVCAGAKMILDIGRTLEYLETMGVPVLGLDTDDFPAFYCRRSGFGVDYNAKTPADVAAIAKAKWDMGLGGGLLIGNPVPEEYAMDFDAMSATIDRALAMAEEAGVKGKNITPFLLAHIVELTGGDSLKTNIQLAFNNARAAARIAVELAKL